MSSGKTHLIIGVLIVALIVGYVLYHDLLNLAGQGSKLLTGFLFVGLYAMLPDVDIPNSTISRYVRLMLLVTAMVMAVYYYVFRNDWRAGLIALICMIILIILSVSSHRKFIHTPLMGLILALPLAYFSWIWVGMAWAGWMSHLILDGEVFK